MTNCEVANRFRCSRNEICGVLKLSKMSLLPMFLFQTVGWYSGQPGRSCKHIRDSGGSRGDGEYWIDPERSGNSLKVFCDMTTDGGMLWIVIVTIMSKTIAFSGTQ